ncbi:MAG: phosphatidylserine decarboxylase [Spirochaetaceae bacterium]|jgi:phosphatidylserine decarboxylase|nr:phosphatidylserine decarboxylase [Spirochaetaceae bacterium]
MFMVKEGLPFVIMPLAGAAAVFILCNGILGAVFGSLLFIIALFCAFFFRDPKINITEGESLVISPCNGTIMEIKEDKNEKVIRVFLSIFNVHLQRAPVSGVVRGVEHRKGSFLMAMHPEAFLLNEQNIITIENERGIFIVRQIAGFLARRCVAWVKTGDVLVKGGKIGLIKFSSQVDLHLPVNAEICVKKGEKVKAGVSICARFGE